MAEQATEPTDWAGALQQIFAEPWRVRPAFQPIFDLARKDVWGFQVLARFISPLRAAPPEWLSAAERLGLRAALETRLLTAGLAALPDVPERGRLLLPLSPASLLESAVHRELSRYVAEMLHVVIDITGDGAPVALSELIDVLGPLRSDGGQIAVTAGASPDGLDGLPRLRPDVLKLGRAFVSELESDGTQSAVVAGLVQLVDQLGGRVLAVGVEDQSQLDALDRAGITLGQGFGLGRPVPSMAANLTRVGALLRG